MDRAGKRSRIALKGVGLLLALNVGVFAGGMVLQYWAPATQAPVVFNAEKIKLLQLPAEQDAEPVSEALASDELASSEATLAEEAEAAVEAMAAEPTVQEQSANKPRVEEIKGSRCLSWATLDAESLQRVETHVQQIGFSASNYTFTLDKTLGWWVFLPPRANKAELDAAIKEVRRLGVSDFAPVRGGSMRFAISLGAFSSFEQARSHAVTMLSMGVRGVKFGPRLESGQVRLIISDSIADAELPAADSGWPQGLQPTPCSVP